MNLFGAGSLRSERARLNRLVRELTERRTARIMRDDQTITTHTGPALLEELRAAVAVGGESTGMGAAEPGSKLPLAPNAADTLAIVERRVIQMQLQASRADGVSIESRLQLVQGIVLGWSRPEDVVWACEQLQQVADLIADTLAPARRFTLRRPCPSCGVQAVARLDDLGETVMVPALTVDDRQGAHCAACGLRWTPAQIELLARLFEQQDQDARGRYEQARAEQDPVEAEANWPEWEELDEDTRKAWREWQPDSADEAVDGEVEPAPQPVDEVRCRVTELIASQCAHCKAGAPSTT